MLKIARNAGATVVRSGSESEAHLQLPAATLDSRMSEMALEHFAADRLPAQDARQAVLGLPGRPAGDPQRRARTRRAPQSAPLSAPRQADRRGAARHRRVPVSLSSPNSALPQWPTLTLNARPPNAKTSAASCRSSPSSSIPGPDSRDELIETLADAEDNDVIGAESRVMLEGVLRMADMTAGDVMVAAPRMDLLNIDAPLDALLQPGDRHRALALPGLRGREGKHHRHPAGEGPAQAAARAGAEHPRAAAARRPSCPRARA